MYHTCYIDIQGAGDIWFSEFPSTRLDKNKVAK